MTTQSGGLERYEKRFGVLAVEQGYITQEQLFEALRAQVAEDLAGGGHRRIGQILVAQGAMRPDKVEAVVRAVLKLRAAT
jgi:hypothetical protein